MNSPSPAKRSDIRPNDTGRMSWASHSGKSPLGSTVGQTIPSTGSPGSRPMRAFMGPESHPQTLSPSTESPYSRDSVMSLQEPLASIQHSPAATRLVNRLRMRAEPGLRMRSVASTARCCRCRVASEAPRKPTHTISTSAMFAPPGTSSEIAGTSRWR
jgi:hypothetical protein